MNAGNVHIDEKISLEMSNLDSKMSAAGASPAVRAASTPSVGTVTNCVTVEVGDEYDMSEMTTMTEMTGDASESNSRKHKVKKYRKKCGYNATVSAVPREASGRVRSDHLGTMPDQAGLESAADAPQPNAASATPDSERTSCNAWV